MANDVKIRFRDYLPGAGVDSAGEAKQGKTRVCGIIDVTSYTGGAGEPMTAIEMGMTAIDTLQMRVVNSVPGGDGKHAREAVYADDTETFYLINVDAAGSRTHFAVAATAVVEFDVFGDSAHDVELT
jgi:hypothetical protein